MLGESKTSGLFLSFAQKIALFAISQTLQNALHAPRVMNGSSIRIVFKIAPTASILQDPIAFLAISSAKLAQVPQSAQPAILLMCSTAVTAMMSAQMAIIIVQGLALLATLIKSAHLMAQAKEQVA